MFVLGLTGSIGMGKSTVARMFAARGVPVHDADATVHRLYAEAAVAPIAELFPEAVAGGTVDRAALGRAVLGDPQALRRLEAVVHPLVRAAELDFLDRSAAAGARIAVVEVPLLLETGGGERVDAVAVVSAPASIQRERVLSRGDMSEEKLTKILARQMPDEEKRHRAHFVIDTGGALDLTEKQVDDVLRALAGRSGTAYSRRKGKQGMRELVFDTETTGLDPGRGDRVVEIGCVELVDHFPTGRTWHRYINPERDMPQEAFAVHGLSAEFLSDKPVFADIAQDFVEFVGDARLVAHNASFDMAFINAELERLAVPAIAFERVVDTLMLARRRHPAGPNSLDDLCRRYGIDLSRRTLHGALLDAQLLAEVYIELIGGRQTRLTLVETTTVMGTAATASLRPRPVPLPSRLDAGELAAHAAFVATLGETQLWQRYAEDERAG